MNYIQRQRRIGELRDQLHDLYHRNDCSPKEINKVTSELQSLERQQKESEKTSQFIGKCTSYFHRDKG